MEGMTGALKRNRVKTRDEIWARGEKISKQPAPPAWLRALLFEWHICFYSSWFILTISSRTNEPAETLHNSVPSVRRDKSHLATEWQQSAELVYMHRYLSTISMCLSSFAPEWVKFYSWFCKSSYGYFSLPEVWWVFCLVWILFRSFIYIWIFLYIYTQLAYTRMHIHTYIRCTWKHDRPFLDFILLHTIPWWHLCLAWNFQTSLY